MNVNTRICGNNVIELLLAKYTKSHNLEKLKSTGLINWSNVIISNKSLNLIN